MHDAEPNMQPFLHIDNLAMQVRIKGTDQWKVDYILCVLMLEVQTLSELLCTVGYGPHQNNSKLQNLRIDVSGRASSMLCRCRLY